MNTAKKIVTTLVSINELAFLTVLVVSSGGRNTANLFLAHVMPESLLSKKKYFSFDKPDILIHKRPGKHLKLVTHTDLEYIQRWGGDDGS